MGLKTYLTEAIFNLDADVNFIYNKYFKDLVKAVKDENVLRLKHYLRNPVLGTFDSSVLRSQDCKEAHKINPVEIIVCISESGSYYNFHSKSIQISANYQAIVFLYKYDFDLNILRSQSMKRTILKELTEISIKGTISHELAHWIDDSKHNKHISKMLSSYGTKTREYVAKTFTKGLTSNIDLTKFEINAQIQAFGEIKKLMTQQEYDRLSLMDAFTLKPFFDWLLQSLSEKEYKFFMRKLVTRLSRENLLGKSMRILPFNIYVKKYRD